MRQEARPDQPRLALASLMNSALTRSLTVPQKLGPARAAGDQIERRWHLLSAHSLLAAAILFVSLMQLELAFSKSLNWDEFWHYGLLREQYFGSSERILQVPFAYLFGWVSSLPGSAIDHVIVARLLTWPFFAWTAFMVGLGAKRFVSSPVAVLTALAYMTGGYAFLHGFALRADPIAAALMTSALVIGLYGIKSAARLALFAVLIGLGLIASIKSALYLPAFLALPLLGNRTAGISRSHLKAIAIAVAAAAAILLAFIVAAPNQLASVWAGASAAAERMFGGGLLPQPRYAARAFAFAPFLSGTIAVAVILIARGSADRSGVQHRIGTALLMAPLGSVLIYLNAYPYFYVFILPPVLIAASIGIDAVVRRYGMRMVTLALLANAAVLWIVEDRNVINDQRRFQQIGMSMLGKPAKYLDNAGLLAPYPRAVNQFWSGWALETYRSSARPIIREAMARDTIPMVIASTPALLNAFAAHDDRQGLLPQDRAALQENYLHVWGPFYLAGKTIEAGRQIRSIDVAVPGLYKVKEAEISIDGRRYAPEDVVRLARGSHHVVPHARHNAALRWAESAEVAQGDLPELTIFTDY